MSTAGSAEIAAEVRRMEEDVKGDDEHQGADPADDSAVVADASGDSSPETPPAEQEDVDQLVLTENMKNLLKSEEEQSSSSVVVTAASSALQNISAAYDDTSEDSSEDSDDSGEPWQNAADDDGDDSCDEGGAKTTKQDTRTKFLADLGINNLPPVPDLSTLSLEPSDKSEYLHMGNVYAVIDLLVTVEALPNMPAYDLDTPLYYGDERKPLGVVFDVIGQVTAPSYAVRFNTSEEAMQVEKGAKVYTLPKSSLTHYVFVKELLKMKGSDASWTGDAEAPDDVQDFSDDEQERQVRGRRQGRKRAGGSAEKHRRFEKLMNQCNTLNTHVHNYLGGGEAAAAAAVAGVPAFDPSRPPPGFPHYQHAPHAPMVWGVPPGLHDYKPWSSTTNWDPAWTQYVVERPPGPAVWPRDGPSNSKS